MKFLRLIQTHMKASSVLLRKMHPGVLCDVAMSEAGPTQELVPPECTTQLWSDDSIEVTSIKPQVTRHQVIFDAFRYIHAQIHTHIPLCYINMGI